ATLSQETSTKFASDVKPVDGMFRFVVALMCLFTLGSGLVISDTVQPNGKNTVALAKAQKAQNEAEDADEISDKEEDFKEAEIKDQMTAKDYDKERKEEAAQIQKQDKEGSKVSDAERKELEKTLKDEPMPITGSEPEESEDAYDVDAEETPDLVNENDHAVEVEESMEHGEDEG
ncbi:unnamed protein product, partial [Symbiodinium microadriaticum]